MSQQAKYNIFIFILFLCVTITNLVYYNTYKDDKCFTTVFSFTTSRRLALNKEFLNENKEDMMSDKVGMRYFSLLQKQK